MLNSEPNLEMMSLKMEHFENTYADILKIHDKSNNHDSNDIRLDN